MALKWPAADVHTGGPAADRWRARRLSRVRIRGRRQAHTREALRTRCRLSPVAVVVTPASRKLLFLSQSRRLYNYEENTMTAPVAIGRGRPTFAAAFVLCVAAAAVRIDGSMLGPVSLNRNRFNLLNVIVYWIPVFIGKNYFFFFVIVSWFEKTHFSII